jgi:predicted thioesterase
MKESLREGLSTTQRISVTEDRTIDFLVADQADPGDASARVYATPALVADIETVCRDFLLEHLDEGEDSLGTRIDVEHLAPTLQGMWVEITATIAQVDGRAVTFDLSACDPVDESVVRGRHNRFIIDVEKTRQRLAAKASKAAKA